MVCSLNMTFPDTMIAFLGESVRITRHKAGSASVTRTIGDKPTIR